MHNKIFNNITETVGNTPLVRINKLNQRKDVTILAKIESFNPLSSVKDRIGKALIEDAEKNGLINKNTTIIEPTSGNTGIALAFIAAAKGYHLKLTMPETMSQERRKLLKILGAELILTEGSKGMQGAIDKAKELALNIPNSFIPQQFQNQANPFIHSQTTAEEIWNDTKGKVDYFIAGVGTGGTITGVGERLKKLNPDIQIIALEPEESQVISGKPSGPHKIQGIGAGFIPDVLNTEIIDHIITINSQDAAQTAKKLAQKEGILVGISGGAAMWAALEVAKKEELTNKVIVTLLPDSGERYLSTWLFDDC